VTVPWSAWVNFDVYPVVWRGRVATIIFTSSVVIDERFRGRQLILRPGLRVLLRTRLRRPLRPRLTDAGGSRRFLDHLAQQHYGVNWRPETGVASRSGQKCLLPTAAPLDAAALCDPDVSFFGTVNPGHRDGDRLRLPGPLVVGQSDRGDRPYVEVLIPQPSLQTPLQGSVGSQTPSECQI
jgi:hypothetical protein